MLIQRADQASACKMPRADVASLTKYIVCCERGDHNFSLIGSNNECSDIIFIITIIIMLTMKIIKDK